MNSMTGFGRGESMGEGLGAGFVVEISTVNRKQLEIRISLPPELGRFEPVLRELIRKRLSRGSVMAKVELSHSGSPASAPVFNEAAAAVLYERLLAFQRRMGIPGAVEMTDLVNAPGIVDLGGGGMDVGRLEPIFVEASEAALDALARMRRREGVVLADDLLVRIERLSELTAEIEPLAVKLPAAHLARLERRLADCDLAGEAHKEFLARELVMFSDRCDVSEELTRLRSHLEQFRSFIGADAPVGRSLDFLVQETHREINTLGNKALSTEISPLVVRMKTELEKIREQTQNIE